MHRPQQNVIRSLERITQRDPRPQYAQQLLVRDSDERVDMLGQFIDALFGDLHAAFELKGKRFSDYRYGKNPHLLCQLRDDWTSPSARTDAHTRGQENHVRALENLRDAVAVFQRRLTPNLGVCPRPQSFGDTASQLQYGACGGVF